MKFIFSFLFFLNHANAFTLITANGLRFPVSDVKIHVAANACTVAGFNSAEELVAMVQESVESYWNRVATCALRLDVIGVATGVDTSSDTLTQTINKGNANEIIIGCSDDSSTFSGTTLGVGTIGTAGGIVKGALLLNNNNTTFANLSKQDKLATIAHELGHAFGLGHSKEPVSLMYYASGGKVQTALTIDDYDGCSWLYPHDAPGSCSVLPISPDLGGKGQGSLWLDNKNQRNNQNKNALLLMIIAMVISISLKKICSGKTFKNKWT